MKKAIERAIALLRKAEAASAKGAKKGATRDSKKASNKSAATIVLKAIDVLEEAVKKAIGDGSDNEKP
jgi:hypothetical protein